MIGFIVALLAGLLMSVQGVFNTKVMDSSSIWVTSSWVHFSALILSLLLWLFKREGNIFSVFSVENKAYLLGGVIGAIITFTVIKAIGNLGPIYATMLILIAQLVTSSVIEMLGLFGVEQMPFEWKKLIGVSLMLLGIIIFKR